MDDQAHIPDGDDAPELPHCFGFQMGWMMEDGIADPDVTRGCYDCFAFERCTRISSVRSLQLIRFEIRRAAQGMRDSLGGSHSKPFW